MKNTILLLNVFVYSHIIDDKKLLLYNTENIDNE